MDLTIPITGKEPTEGFDYSVMDQDTAKFAETKAAEIWQRHNRMVDDWIVTAAILDEVAARFLAARKERGWNVTAEDTFKKWVERETPYSESYAGKMRATARRLADTGRPRVAIPSSVAQEIVRESVPNNIVNAILDRAESGDVPSLREARKIRQAANEMDSEAPLPSPTKANQIARDTGKPQVATDGRLYIGLTPEEVEQGKAENKLDFGIIDGVAFFSSIEISPEEWLAQDSSALMEWSVTDPPPIREAADWLKGLAKAWKEYAKAKSINGESHEAAE